MPTYSRRMLVRAFAPVVLALTCTSSVQAAAHAMPPQDTVHQTAAAPSHAERPAAAKPADAGPSRKASPSSRIMSVARAQAGDPYRYGAAGPDAFDCSGYTQYVYRVAVGRSLPHSSSAQRGAARSISRAAARPGDLVFFHGGSGVYHVAIYAGDNSVWHASRPGEVIHRERIWTSSISFGRIG